MLACDGLQKITLRRVIFWRRVTWMLSTRSSYSTLKPFVWCFHLRFKNHLVLLDAIGTAWFPHCWNDFGIKFFVWRKRKASKSWVVDTKAHEALYPVPRPSNRFVPKQGLHWRPPSAPACSGTIRPSKSIQGRRDPKVTFLDVFRRLFRSELCVFLRVWSCEKCAVHHWHYENG